MGMFTFILLTPIIRFLLYIDYLDIPPYFYVILIFSYTKYTPAGDGAGPS